MCCRITIPQKKAASQGEAVGLTLDEQIYIERGEIASLAAEEPPHVSTRVRVSLFWLGRQPMVKGKQYLFKLGTVRVRMLIERIINVINAAEISSGQYKQQVDLHDVAECILTTHKAVAFDLTDSLADTSRFVVVDDNEICGGGIILESLPDDQQDTRDEKRLRNQKWIPSDITQQERAQQYQQQPQLVVITGKRKTGRKTLARAVEKALFSQGRFVYYLGMGSVVYGINQDLEQNGSGKHRREHVRRLAEVVHILLDSGMIVLVTALELTAEDLQMIQTLAETNSVKVVWVGGEVSTDVPVDLYLDPSTHIAERTQALEKLLDFYQ